MYSRSPAQLGVQVPAQHPVNPAQPRPAGCQRPSCCSPLGFCSSAGESQASSKEAGAELSSSAGDVTCQALDASADGHGLCLPPFLSHRNLVGESCCSGSAGCSAAESIQRGGSRSQCSFVCAAGDREVVASGMEKSWSSLVWGRRWGHSGQGKSSVWSLGTWLTLQGLGNDLGKVAVSEHWCRIAIEKSEETLKHFYTEKYLHLSINKHLLYLGKSNPVPNLK